ncbi:hypothetical protein SADUNF_Sadunf13G0078800 [Salix dunnii]|uniref:VTT domain-containing protein n=1 Tax=Salix dunnii TaxID=1413687 RepID=A0A835JG20_9ROSI|nr:hypothetical protein SADUNF_Sadunf13G0078800 [Salix dunnii]
MRTLLYSRLLTPPPPFLTTNFHSSPPPCSLFQHSFRPNKRTHFLAPCSSLKQTKKQPQTLRKTNAPQSLRWFLNPKGDDSDDKIKGDGGEAEKGLEGDTAFKGTLLAGVLLFGVLGGFGAAGYIYKDQINAFLNHFSGFIEVSPFGEEELRAGSKMTEDEANGPVLRYGPAGYALFVAVYAGLEILAIPAIPLTMSAGVLFGSLVGTIIVSISGTVAASIAFLIARYFARERILKLVEGNKKFLAIDKAIGENGFKVVTLLRLSPLLPFSLGNYLYGLTSVKFIPYILGSWLGMLPGTWAYVSAGAFGRAIIDGKENGNGEMGDEARYGEGEISTREKGVEKIRNQKSPSTELAIIVPIAQEESQLGLGGGNGGLWTLGLGLLAMAIAAIYVTRLAKDAVKDIE